MRKPIYKQTSAYGHFGNPDFPWEKLDNVEELKKAISETVKEDSFNNLFASAIRSSLIYSRMLFHVALLNCVLKNERLQ